MRTLGTLRGQGRVMLGEQDLGPAQYNITVSHDGRFKSADGILTADDGVVWEIHQAPELATLILSDGEPLSFMVSRYSVGSGSAHIKASGKIPGF